jgi:predicted amidohydrolase
MPRTLRCATVQFEPRPDDKDFNLSRIRHFTADAARNGVQLITFPEMCTVGYWHLRRQTPDRLRELAEPLTGPTITAVRDLAAKYDLAVGVGFLEADQTDGRLYNSYALCLPDGQIHRHRKLHAFEHEAIESGDAFTVFDTPWGVRMAILICWDNNLVENVRAVALHGAEVLLAPHQTGGTHSRSPHGMRPIPQAAWDNRASDPDTIEAHLRGQSARGWLLRWLPSRAHDNGLFIVFSNGIGQDDDEIRTGNAMIIDPYGRIIEETWAAADAMVTADLDLDLIPLATGRRWMQGRRPELYEILTHRFGDERDARTTRFSAEPVDPERPLPNSAW